MAWTILLAAAAAAYDPLATEAAGGELDLVVADGGRYVPVLVYLPAADGPQPVVLFSHGMGGSRRGSTYLGRHWAGRGYVAVFLQHPGSDESVWKDQPLRERRAALIAAANVRQFQARTRDVAAVLERLAEWNADDAHPLRGRLDMQNVGMSGHSFGARTTQIVSGQTVPFGRPDSAFDRIKAAAILSPSPPGRGSADRAFGGVAKPWLLITGTHDNDSGIGRGTPAEDRRKVYPALPDTVTKYELVLDKAEHSAFTDRRLSADKVARNPNHHRSVLAISTAFWDAHLRGDAAARKWLHGDGPRGVLEPDDLWQKNVPDDSPAE